MSKNVFSEFQMNELEKNPIIFVFKFITTNKIPRRVIRFLGRPRFLDLKITGIRRETIASYSHFCIFVALNAYSFFLIIEQK